MTEKRVFGEVNHSKSDRLGSKESRLRDVCSVILSTGIVERLW
ncbi:MAG TPA: hypothetical protein VEG44_04600 [Candidatus Acidoferrales bacterium]|nr:hypothetical protein [Candidatus Acidoferrales bacterium]